MENKTLSLNPAARGHGPRPVRPPRRRSKVKEVVVEQTTRRRIPAAKPPVSPFKTRHESKPAHDKPKRTKLSEEREKLLRAALAREAIRKEAERRQQEQEARKREEEHERLKRVRQQQIEQEAEDRRRKQEEEERQRLEKERLEEEERRREAEAARKKAAAKPDETSGKKEASKPAPSRKPDRKRVKDRDAAVHRPGRTVVERRRRGKLTVTKALSGEERQRSHAAYLRSQQRKKRKAMDSPVVREKVIREVQLPETIVVQELANRMAERVSDVVKMLMKNGVMVTQNQSIDADTAELIVNEFGHTVSRVSDSDVEDVIVTVGDKPDDLIPRPPVIAVMGHVDHGKTSLLDIIRKAHVASGEAGGITQHIGAYTVKRANGQTYTFLDTPGHAAFTEMRARGAHATDIVVLVVAADDSVMPQTIEAINHAKAAEVPMIVAINKCDRPNADPDRVRNQLLNHSVTVEKRSGDVLDVEMSALTGDGIDDLLEAISLQAEILEIKANPDREAEGVVIEAKLDIGRGPVATILVRNGTLRKGDIFVVGEQWGKVRALLNDSGERVESSSPSTPVEVLGLNGAPQPGDVLNVVETESQARMISEYRTKMTRDKRAAAGATSGLETIMLIQDGMNRAAVTDLQVVVKADVQGSAEAITQALENIGNDEVRVRVLHSGVGAITETDVALAQASNAIIVAFNVRANALARNAAQRQGVEVRYHSVIYALVDDIRSVASGLLAAEIKETTLGQAEILELFKITGVGNVAGCRVFEGVVRRTAKVRLKRDNAVVHVGKLKTLKRFKDEVSEVQAGQECGMAFENYANMRQGDFVEFFEQEEIQRSL